MAIDLSLSSHVHRGLVGMVYFALTWPLLLTLSFTPAPLIPLLAAATGIAGFISPDLGVALSLGLVALPLLAADVFTGMVFLLCAAVFFPFLARRSGTVYLLIGGAVVLAAAGPVWAIAALAGFLLGPAAGAGAAALACLCVQAAAILAAHTHVGMVASAAAGPGLAGITSPPADLIGLAWLASSVQALDPAPLLGVLPAGDAIPLIIGQVAAWVGGAAVAGLLVRPARHPRRAASALIAVAAGVTTTALAHVAVLGMNDALPDSGVRSAFAASLALGLSAVVLREWIFPPAPRPGTVARSSRPHRDVDALLQTIAQAEDELTSKHVTTATVLITDMQAFSALTESAGSLVSARVIQRQRKLLLPIVAAYCGNGVPAGGDGLVAAFADPLAAVRAAIAMQESLAAHNRSATPGQEIVVRAGIARGEVVVDCDGRPFVGEAINLAARIMQLADGGEVYVSRDVADTVAPFDIATEPRGLHELHNISGQVEVAVVTSRLHVPAHETTVSATKGPSNVKAPA
ncbi:MAG: adenylate/guanylate cyclase domain-containing protein [Coriobacteriia bacterium]|jgi:class 3 adenylate cyclase|nr:adenylate/guanylate cyclase domain-containing protein [Coriobacteriia bacterium]